MVFLWMQGSSMAQLDRLTLVHLRTGDTVMLDPSGILEVWADGKVHEGEVMSVTDSTLVMALHDGLSGDVPMGVVELRSEEVTQILYWKGFAEGRSFDAAAYRKRRRRMDGIATGVGVLGAGLAFMVDARIGALVVLVAVGIHVVALVQANAHFSTYRLGRKWRIG